MISLRSLSFALIFSFAISVFAQTTPLEYPRAEERAKVLELLKEVKAREGTLEISDWDQRTEKEKAFLDHYRTQIFPFEIEYERLQSVAGILSVSIDRALYNDEAEKNAWIAEMDAAEIQASSKVAAEEYKVALKRSAELAAGLTGELPDEARKSYEYDQLKGFNETLMPLVEKLTRMSTIITQKSNLSKVTGNDLAVYQQGLEDLEKDFRAGRIGFADATRKIAELWSKGFHAKGEDLATTAREELNETARIRTELARAKGFSNWAEYVTASEKYTHERGFATAEERIAFLTRVLEETLPAQIRFRQWLKAQHPGIPSENIDNRNSFLLVPETDTMVTEYFPVENVNNFWHQTMLEMGFTPQSYENINLDSFPRENKQTHAYMANVVSMRPKQVRLVPGKLNFELPAPGEAWSPAMIYIVQNARIDGMDAYSTVFHEGGHGLDYSHRLSVIGVGTAYGYTETASMTMERFFADREFLLAKGRTRDGRQIPAAVVDQFLENQAMLAAIGSRGQVFNALFDLLIWKEAYTSSSTPFVDRMMQIYDELQAKYFPGPKVFPPDVRPGSRMLATSHFYSGEVRYFGYIVADMSAQMTADALWDFALETSGRRTFLNQPTLAKKLIEGQYQRGHSKKFPLSVEEFTGKKFRPESLIQTINGAVPDLVRPSNEPKTCGDLLKTARH